MKNNLWLLLWTLVLCGMMAACGGGSSDAGVEGTSEGANTEASAATSAAAKSDDGAVDLVGSYAVSFDMEELMKGEELDSAGAALTKAMLDMLKMDMEFTADGKTKVSGGMAEMMEETQAEGSYRVEGDKVMLKMTNDQELEEAFDIVRTDDGFRLSQDSVTMVLKRK